MRNETSERPVALVTGASAGLGLALARRWSGRYQLVLTGRRDALEDRLADDAIYVPADLTRPQTAVATLLQALGEAGIDRLHRVVLNAGTGRHGDPFAEDAGDIRRTLAVNLAAPVSLAHALFSRLDACGGRLVLIGSVAHGGSALLASYAASKAGLDAFGRALREEWRGRVPVSMIHPGPIATEMHAKAGFDPKGMRRFFASPERMAAMVEAAIETGRDRAILGLGGTLAHRLRHGGRF
ncbi:SDR family NAD(P)-dependent oxidoreductase [Fulvimarina endophytica]|uniref:SDR family NAD(P)-dependent oxidoreductase n=1 Tax=Fulvimarina endophytica TaxID=2293836 RepID=A0A371X7Y5_9HYPH|nr:SDR family NAD(P)-dependent oxidoreductase [Fulvimarina endophytica]RFC65345.1 SDR family NAD(P)-dependent oxidoreductase [Fulvimarina endophytica]